MEITFDCLCECKVENLERLATALGGRIPKHKAFREKAYVRELSREILRRMHRDARGEGSMSSSHEMTWSF
jgi:hypothetical protein